uniref:Biotin carboxyl carrier protein of acetyl-CoA carboxylase n=1 Tax=Laurencia catarinensis TaxID=197326 RepID=UPI0028D7A676|nr:Biotin carboxyl carrier protein of acetyl-CoA carboxylase [Laurencia catarinensis]WMP12501.1 Biotin carboxyl carrier protein of acetyl-CoA carboxylase [Laurencia catarinensis]
MTSLNNIKTLINSIKNNNVEKIKVQQKNTKIFINKTKKHFINIYNYSNKNEEVIISNVKENKTNLNIEQITKGTSQNKTVKTKSVDQSVTYSTIISPMVGTFYRSPAPNESPFVEINSIVKTKQTVCIIEAMKLMNEIEAEVQGEVVEILVKDGDIVDCGQALMKVKMI